jgi:hypothetical protein
MHILISSCLKDKTDEQGPLAVYSAQNRSLESFSIAE